MFINPYYWSNFRTIAGGITSIIILLLIFKKLYPKIVYWIKFKKEKKFYYRYAPKSDMEILKDRLKDALNRAKQYD